MSSTAHPANLLSLAPEDRPTPGAFFFAQVVDDAPSVDTKYWIVLVVPKARLPDYLRKHMCPGDYPCWLVNRPGEGRKFKLLPKSKFFHLSIEQINIVRSEWQEEFRHFYDLATTAAREDPLGFFDYVLQEHRQEAEKPENRPSPAELLALAKRQERKRASHLASGRSDFSGDEVEQELSRLDHMADVRMDLERQKRRRDALDSGGDVQQDDGFRSSRLRDFGRRVRGFGRTAPIARPLNDHLGTVPTNLDNDVNSGGQRSDRLSATPPDNDMFVARSFPLGAQPRATSPRIKTEEEEAENAAVRHLSKGEIVTIHVGTKQNTHRVSRKALLRSPILSSWITEGPDLDSPCIMRPTLLSVDLVIFAKLVQYLISDTYSPKAIATPGRKAYKLEGIEQTPEAYSAELLNAGSLFVLAQQFEVTDLADHVFSKIVNTESRPYTITGLLRFAEIIFSRPNYSNGMIDIQNRPSYARDFQETQKHDQSALDNGILKSSQGDKADMHIDQSCGGDVMEAWVIDRLAEKFSDIITWEGALFLEIAGKSTARGLYPKVLRAKAKKIDRTGGDVVELD